MRHAAQAVPTPPTLTAVLDLRCGGESRGSFTATYTLVGDSLSDGFSTFTR